MKKLSVQKYLNLSPTFMSFPSAPVYGCLLNYFRVKLALLSKISFVYLDLVSFNTFQRYSFSFLIGNKDEMNVYRIFMEELL